MIHPTAFIHPMSVVTDSVVGARSKVWQFSTVIRGTNLGEDCTVASNVTVDMSRFGDRCIFRPGVDIGCGCWAGNDVFFGPLVSLTNDAWPRTHKQGWSVDAFDGRHWAQIIEDGASIGSHSVLLPGVRIGAGSMIAAGSIVRRDVPAHVLWINDEAIPIKSERQRLRFVREHVPEARVASTYG